jgi:hypothetical protein
MSHIAENRTIIKTVNEGCLQETLELMVRANPSLKITQEVATYEGGTQKVDVAIHGAGLLRGIGINFKKDGGLTFVGDGFNCQEAYSDMQSLILRVYQTVATQKALSNMGYSVNVVGETNRSMKLEAVHA